MHQHSLFASLVVAPKPIVTGIALLSGATGAGIGLDMGGVEYAIVGALSAIATSLIAYGVIRTKIAEHERRLDANDEAHDDFGEKLAEHTRAFTTFATEIKGDIGELVGAARQQAANDLKESVKTTRRKRT